MDKNAFTLSRSAAQRLFDFLLFHLFSFSSSSQVFTLFILLLLPYPLCVSVFLEKKEKGKNHIQVKSFYKPVFFC